MELTDPSRYAESAGSAGLADEFANALAIITSNLALAERHAAGNGKLIRLLNNIRQAAEQGGTAAQRLTRATAVSSSSIFMFEAAEEEAALLRPPTSRRILVVEDDPLVAEVAVTVLSDMGHAVTLCHDAPSALAILRDEGRFDLVFFDIVMPGGMSGIEMAEQIACDAPKLPILLATGYSNAALAPGALRFPVLAKPYSVQELSRRVSQMLPA